MKNYKDKSLSPEDEKTLTETLRSRFEKNKKRHEGIKWGNVQERLKSKQEKLLSLFEMENTGGEPDITGYDKLTGEYLFFDCSAESPKGRRSLCYDEAALEARKENKPAGSVTEMASSMGIELLSEEQYRHLQTLGTFDAKSSSWIQTPAAIRKLGGAIFADYRYATVFVYHNGAESYYAARGFRGCLRI